MGSYSYFIGIDGGGTRCRARLEDAHGNLLGRGESGPANIMRDPGVAMASMIDACTQAIAACEDDIALTDICVGAGLAGANIPAASRSAMAWRHPFGDFQVLSDLHAACLGAHNGQSGAMIVCGTGSSATCYQDGTFTDVGGHGFLLGDIASGAWLGHKAVQHTLLCMDGLEPEDEVTSLVCNQVGVTTDIALVQQVSTFSAADYATLAPLLAALCDQGDLIATQFFDEGSAYLERVAVHLLGDTALPLCLTGGLAERYQRSFSASVQERVRPSQLSPEQGAMLHARRHCN